MNFFWKYEASPARDDATAVDDKPQPLGSRQTLGYILLISIMLQMHKTRCWKSIPINGERKSLRPCMACFSRTSTMAPTADFMANW